MNEDVYERVNEAQVKMREDYSKLGAMNTGQFSIVPSFKQKLRGAAEQGLLLFTKYFLVAILVFAALQYFNGLVTGSQNGTQSALYLNELISKGYLPKAGPNGIEPKVETPVAQAK